MAEMKMGVVESHFADIIWANEPLHSRELVKLCEKELGIAATIMEKPEILILDEPLNALDTNGVELFTKIINEEKEKGTLIIISCLGCRISKTQIFYFLKVETM